MLFSQPLLWDVTLRRRVSLIGSEVAAAGAWQFVHSCGFAPIPSSCLSAVLPRLRPARGLSWWRFLHL